MQVTVEKINEVHMRIRSEPAIEMEFSEHFTFDVPGANFMSKFGGWDGKIRLFNLRSKTLYIGLLSQLVQYCDLRGYKVCLLNFDDFILARSIPEGFLQSLKIPSKFADRDYQQKAFLQCIAQGRGLVLSPTSSGKSLIIYWISAFYNRITGKPILIIVPNVGLVGQLATDFADYGCTQEVQQIRTGLTRDFESNYIVSTWQSIRKIPAEVLNGVGAIIVDEAHGAKANVLTNILTSATKVKYRFGFTGSLDGTVTHKMVLEGLFAETIETLKTHELIEQGYAAKLEVKAVVLKHSDEERRTYSKVKYPEEIEFITTHELRNKYIRNLALSIKGNTIILVRRIEHAKALHKLISKERDNTYLVYSKVDADDRNEIRRLMEENDEAITVAGIKSFGVGTNIKNVDNLIMASPTKARIANLQAIGRVIRPKEGKVATLYDLADDLSWGIKKNHTLKHLYSRLSLYDSEQFPYRIYNIDFSD